MNTTIAYRSPQLAGPGRGGLFVTIEPIVPSFWALHIGGRFHGLCLMDDFGFVTPVTPATFFSLKKPS